MDPLSITTSAVTLIQVAGAVSTTLCKLVSKFRNADAKVSTLCHELSTLINLLEAVDRTLEKCRDSPLSLASIDENLWRQSALSLEDCKTTNAELEAFIKRIKSVAKSTGYFRRAKIAVDLTIYSRDISVFQEKINKSNWALQTILSAINVSFSLRGNVGQDAILDELEKLKVTVEQSLRVSLRHGDGLSHALGDPSDARVAHNLRTLARVAQNFHSTASSTASTIQGLHILSGTVQSDVAPSFRGRPGLTRDKKHLLDRYFKSMRRTMKREPLPKDSIVTTAMIPEPVPVVSSGEEVSTSSETGDEKDEDDENVEGEDDTEFELLFLNGYEEVARDSMMSSDFDRAETILEKAIQERIGSSSDKSDFRKLQIQLAACYFFQPKWRLAEPLITGIARSKASLDRVICNLLHALALAHLADYSFEKSIAICKQALRGKRRLRRAFGVAHEAECNETLGLLATIYDTKGDHLRAEILRRTITADFSYKHPLNELEFIAEHPNLFQDIIGGKANLKWGSSSAAEQKLTLGAKSSEKEIEDTVEEVIGILYNRSMAVKKPLQTLGAKLELAEKYNKDTDKEINVVVVPLYSTKELARPDSGYSSMPPSPISPEIAPKRPFTRKLTRFLSTGKIAPQSSADVSATQPSPVSPTRLRLGKGFWSKNNTNILNRRLLSRRKRSCTCEGCGKNEPEILDSSFWVGQWLRGTPAIMNDPSPSITTDETQLCPSDDFDPLMTSAIECGGHQVHEMMDTMIPVEMCASSSSVTSLSSPRSWINKRFWSKSNLNLRSRKSCQKEDLPIKAAPYSADDHSPVYTDSTSLHYSESNGVARTPSVLEHSSNPRAAHLGSTLYQSEFMFVDPGATTVSRNDCESNIESLSPEHDEIIMSENSTVVTPMVSAVSALSTPCSSSKPYLSAISGYTGAKSKQVPPNIGDGKQMSNKDSTVSLSPAPGPATIMAKVLYDFSGENENELMVKMNDIVQIVERSTQGWLLGKKDGKLGFVPAAYVDMNPPISNPATAREYKLSLDPPPKRLAECRFPAVNGSKSCEDSLGNENANQDSESACRPERELSWTCGDDGANSRLILENADLEVEPADTDKDRFSWSSDDSGLFTSASMPISSRESYVLAEGANGPSAAIQNPGPLAPKEVIAIVSPLEELLMSLASSIGLGFVLNKSRLSPLRPHIKKRSQMSSTVRDQIKYTLVDTYLM